MRVYVVDRPTTVYRDETTTLKTEVQEVESIMIATGEASLRPDHREWCNQDDKQGRTKSVSLLER